MMMLKVKDKTGQFSLKIELRRSISTTVCSKKVDHNQISNKRMFPRKLLASLQIVQKHFRLALPELL